MIVQQMYCQSIYQRVEVSRQDDARVWIIIIIIEWMTSRFQSMYFIAKKDLIILPWRTTYKHDTYYLTLSLFFIYSVNKINE